MTCVKVRAPNLEVITVLGRQLEDKLWNKDQGKGLIIIVGTHEES